VEFQDKCYKKNARDVTSALRVDRLPASYAPNEVCGKLVWENTPFPIDKFILAAKRSNAADPPRLDMIQSLPYFVLEVQGEREPGILHENTLLLVQNKLSQGEIILLYKEALTLNPELGEEFISNFTQNAVKKERDGAVVSTAAETLGRTNNKGKSDTFDHMTKLLELFVTSSKTKEYNEKYIANYYNPMISLSKPHPTFCWRILNHGNWMWSLRVFIFNAAVNEKGEMYQTQSDDAIFFAVWDVPFWEALFKELLERNHGNEKENKNVHKLKFIKANKRWKSI